MMERGMGDHHSGAEKRETDGRKAERIVQEELEKRGWSEEDLAARRKTDGDKTAIAARLRRQTVMTLDWIAKRLKMGRRHTAANCLKKITNSLD
jgi:ribosome-binding protein aMBF1 (putative translation factor)